MAKSKWNSENIADQAGRVIVITGSTSGLGKEAAKVLSGKNAKVVMAVRNVSKGENVKKDILSQFPKAQISVKRLDLGDLATVKQFAAEMESEFGQLDVLINNAGVMACPYSTTKDGFEIQMGTNHLGPFALTVQLLPLLKKTKNSRVVVTSSIAHRQGNIDFSDFGWKNRSYKTGRAYGDSKIANLYFTYELAKKLNDDPHAPKVTAAHPGWTITDLQRHSGTFRFLNPIFGQGVETGTLPTLRAAFDPQAESGDYYGPSGFMEMRGAPVIVKSNKLSHDQETAQKLWEVSEEMTGVKFA